MSNVIGISRSPFHGSLEMTSSWIDLISKVGCPKRENLLSLYIIVE